MTEVIKNQIWIHFKHSYTQTGVTVRWRKADALTPGVIGDAIFITMKEIQVYKHVPINMHLCIEYDQGYTQVIDRDKCIVDGTNTYIRIIYLSKG